MKLVHFCFHLINITKAGDVVKRIPLINQW